MKAKNYRVQTNDSISYSLEIKDKNAELGIYFWHGKPEHIIFDYTNREFNNYSGYRRNKFKNADKSELKNHFINGLNYFSNHINNINPPINQTEKKELREIIETLLKSIK
ncbi:MAG: hypothetical protein ACOCWG_04275 [bacterium]